MVPAVAYVLADTAYAGTADLSNRVEVRARDTEGVLGVDLVDEPIAHVALSNRRWEYLLDYTALAMLPDLELGLSPQLLQVGDISATWHTRRVRIGLTEYAQYGYENSAYLLSAQPAAAAPSSPTVPVGGGTQLLAAPVTLLYGGSRTVLESQLVFSRRWSGTASIEYDMEGGVDASSRAYLPFATGPRADATATYALTRIDRLQTRASALESSATTALCSPAVIGVPDGSQCDPSAAEATIAENWEHRLTPTWGSIVGAGAAYLRARLMDTRPYEQFVYPVAEASIEHATGTPEYRSVLRLEALLAPVLDVRIGLLDERAQAFLNFTQPLGITTVSTVVSAARSIDSPFMQPATTFQALVDTEVRLSRIVSVGGGVQYVWQDQGTLGTFSGGFVFGAVTVRAPRIHF